MLLGFCIVMPTFVLDDVVMDLSVNKMTGPEEQRTRQAPGKMTLEARLLRERLMSGIDHLISDGCVASSTMKRVPIESQLGYSWWLGSGSFSFDPNPSISDIQTGLLRFSSTAPDKTDTDVSDMLPMVGIILEPLDRMEEPFIAIA